MARAERRADTGAEWPVVDRVRRHDEASPSGRRIRVLVVEDPRDGEGELGARLVQAGFAVRVCADGPGGLYAFVRELPDLIVARDRLGGIDGFELIRRVREISDVAVVLVASEPSLASRERALRLGVDRFLVRTLHREDDLVQAVVELARSLRPPRRSSERLTAAHVRRAARSELQAELERLLVECRGNLAEIGRRMGKDRSTIRYHLQRFGMLAEEGSAWTDLCTGDASRGGSAPA